MNSEDGMTIEQLRRELRQAWDDQHEFWDALRSLPEVPSVRVLDWLSNASEYPRDTIAGNEMQRRLGFGVIPPKSEYECGAGLWKLIREGIKNSPETTS